jgi:hypothetical protein
MDKRGKILSLIAKCSNEDINVLYNFLFEHQVEAPKVSDNEAKRKICRYYGECYWKSKEDKTYCNTICGCEHQSD